MSRTPAALDLPGGKKNKITRREPQIKHTRMVENGWTACVDFKKKTFFLFLKMTGMWCAKPQRRQLVSWQVFSACKKETGLRFFAEKHSLLTIKHLILGMFEFPEV